jgi:hypothetical protein
MLRNPSARRLRKPFFASATARRRCSACRTVDEPSAPSHENRRPGTQQARRLVPEFPNGADSDATLVTIMRRVSGGGGRGCPWAGGQRIGAAVVWQCAMCVDRENSIRCRDY